MSQAFLNSASSFIQLLKESDHQLNIIGLQKLLPLIDTHWQEISEYLDLIEEFHENENFPERKLAAFIASKIYYNLQEEKESLDYALKSGDFFDIEENSQYAECLVNTCIANYMNYMQKVYDQKEELDLENEVGPEYEQIVDRMFRKSIDANNLKDAIGLAIECRRVGVITKILDIDLVKNPNNNDLLRYLFQVSMDIIKNRKFRIEILKLITQYQSKKKLTGQDYLNLCLCYFQYDDYEKVAEILNQLISSNEKDKLLIAYQIANEISENENQYFINRVISAFPIENNVTTATENRQYLIKILNGEVRKRLNQIFLQTKNYTDPALLNKLKDLTNQRQSIQVGGVSFANGILNAGTNDQSFLEKNMEWFQNNKYWNKFSMVAGLGVIHKGSQKNYQKIFEDFLPGSTSKLQQGKNPNSNGGSLYGIGLMHEGSKNPEIMNYFKSILANGEYMQNETIVHGCALGMGLVGLASEDANIQTDLSNILSTSQSVSAEAAAISIGTVMAGSGKQDVIEELLNFAEETDKDKIARGCALAVAMIVFGQEQAADQVIKSMLTSQNNIFRYGGCMALGMAYIGSGNDLAIKKLLNLAVIDVSDDVRRQAVIALAFVMFRVPDEYIKMVKLLSNSYSPHVRYGTALGLGIVCAGTGNAEAYELLEPLLSDNSTPFVRQAAYLGTAMLFQLSNKNNEPKLEKFIKTLEDCLSKKSDDPIVKLGAYLSFSILNAGGQNQVIKLASQSGFPKLGACIGMLAFSHFWHWFPLVHFYTLALQPSAIIGVNENFRIPKNFEFKSNIKPILTDYIPHEKKDEDKKTEKKSTVSLSITNRAKARAQLKEGQKEGEASKVDNSSLKRVTSKLQSDSKRHELEALNQKKQTEKMELEENEKKEKEKEATYQKYSNPSRVLEKYKKYVEFLPGRYQPIIKERKLGIIFLKDTQPGDEDEYIGGDILAQQQEQTENKQNQNNKDSANDDGPDVEPPEDFIFSLEEQNKQ